MPHYAWTDVEGKWMPDIPIPIHAVVISHTADNKCSNVGDFCRQVKDEQYLQMHRSNASLSKYLRSVIHRIQQRLIVSKGEDCSMRCDRK